MFFFYFSGHGVIINNTLTSCVGADGQLIPIEDWVRTLSMCPNTLSIGFLDCCRNRVDTKAVDDNEKHNLVTSGQSRMIFSCQSGDKVIYNPNQKLSPATQKFLEYFDGMENIVHPDSFTDLELESTGKGSKVKWQFSN